MSVLDYCSKCSKPLMVKCPCGRPECLLETPTRHCPDCEPEAHAKYHKMHGVKVCEEHVKKQLGASRRARA